jgi:NADH-quinone oxidoreductase subunit A
LAPVHRARPNDVMPEIDNYQAVLLQFVLVAGLAATMLGLSVAVGRAGRRNPVKDSAYECGMLPIGDSQPRFSVKFYLVAMLFVLFDIEVVFMYPWAVVFRDLVAEHAMVFWGMVSFVGILTVAYVYALKKGALRWDN